jgi:hypothetical protein
LLMIIFFYFFIFNSFLGIFLQISLHNRYLISLLILLLYLSTHKKELFSLKKTEINNFFTLFSFLIFFFFLHWLLLCFIFPTASLETSMNSELWKIGFFFWWWQTEIVFHITTRTSFVKARNSIVLVFVRVCVTWRGKKLFFMLQYSTHEVRKWKFFWMKSNSATIPGLNKLHCCSTFFFLLSSYDNDLIHRAIMFQISVFCNCAHSHTNTCKRRIQSYVIFFIWLRLCENPVELNVNEIKFCVRENC